MVLRMISDVSPAIVKQRVIRYAAVTLLARPVAAAATPASSMANSVIRCAHSAFTSFVTLASGPGPAPASARGKTHVQRALSMPLSQDLSGTKQQLAANRRRCVVEKFDHVVWPDIDARGGSPERHPLVAQRGASDLPALAHFADDIAIGNKNLVEEDFVEQRFARHLPQRSDREAVGVQIDHHHRDPAMLRRAGVGAQCGKAPLAVVRVTGPDLLSGNPPAAVDTGADVRMAAASEPALGSLSN